ncbi:hypothetical protein BYT27DRAFT_7189190 [Phlegmacium glaucopus]|nr:hypothetical protein BYT27DRAFT_7189190 [Phlegmacium glaucopus]
MGFSFYDKESISESTVGSLRFAANNPNSISETGDVDIMPQESGDDDTRSVMDASCSLRHSELCLIMGILYHH